MSVAPSPSGSFSTSADADAILRWCEAQRFTGTLAFVLDRVPGEIPLVAGLPELARPSQPDPDAPDGDPVARALDRFVAGSKGTYTLRQHLPPIDGAEAPSDRVVRGPLSLRSPADIMRYCELAGLTGQLQLTHDGDADGACAALYERGELVSLTVDGRDDLDVAAIFDWSSGRFEVTAFPLFDRDPTQRDPLLGAPPSPEEAQLLRTVEVALADILTRRAAAPTTSPRNPSFRPPPRAEATPAAPLPPPPRAPRLEAPPSPDTTVKVYFVQARKPAVVAPQGPAPVAPRVSAGDLVGPAPRSPAELALWATLGLVVLIAAASLVQLLRAD